MLRHCPCGEAIARALAAAARCLLDGECEAAAPAAATATAVCPPLQVRVEFDGSRCGAAVFTFPAQAAERAARRIWIRMVGPDIPCAPEDTEALAAEICNMAFGRALAELHLTGIELHPAPPRIAAGEPTGPESTAAAVLPLEIEVQVRLDESSGGVEP